MAIHPDMQTVFCFPHILNTTFLACNQIHEVSCLTGDVCSDVMSSACYMTHELAAVVYRAARLTSLIAAGGVTGISGRGWDMHISPDE